MYNVSALTSISSIIGGISDLIVLDHTVNTSIYVQCKEEHTYGSVTFLIWSIFIRNKVYTVRFGKFMFGRVRLGWIRSG